MVISPGPGNTLLAAAGGKFGVWRTIPFLIGFEVANLTWCFVYGLGLTQLFISHPFIREILKWAGVIYTLYLAYGFFSSSSLSDQIDMKPLKIIDGFLSVSLNPKIHSMILVMFSQFLNPEYPLFWQVVQISVVFLVVCIVCHLPWVYGGRILFSRIKTEKSLKMQGYVFGTCMILVALFVAFT